MKIDTLADGIYIADKSNPSDVYRVDQAAGRAYRLRPDGSEEHGTELRYFYVTDGYEIVAPPKSEPKFKVGDLIRSKKYGTVWKVVEADRTVERVTSGDIGGAVGYRTAIGNVDVWGTRVRAVTKTEYVPV